MSGKLVLYGHNDTNTGVKNFSLFDKGPKHNESSLVAEATYLRDGGWLDVLEQSGDGLEQWRRCYGVINYNLRQISVHDAPNPDAERLFQGVIRAVHYNDGERTFEVTLGPFDDVAIFRCNSAGRSTAPMTDDVLAAASWAMSLMAVIDEREISLDALLPPLRAPLALAPPSKGHKQNSSQISDLRSEPITSSLHPSATLNLKQRTTIRHDKQNENKPNKAVLETTTRPDQKGRAEYDDKEQTSGNQNDSLDWPPKPNILPCCGYLLVHSAPLSAKWRETYVVLGPDGLAELSAPSRGAIMFLWSPLLNETPEVRLARPKPEEKLEVRLSGCSPVYQSTDSMLAKQPEVILRMTGQSDAMTYAWAYSLRAWLDDQNTALSGIIPNPLRWTSASSIAQFCAKQVLSKSSKRVLAQKAASALACIIDGPHFVTASSQPYKYRLRCLLPERLPNDTDALLKCLTARVVRVGTPKNRLDMEFVGLQMLEVATIVHEKAMDFLIKPTLRQAADYRLHVQYCGYPVYGSPLRIRVDPGRESPLHCTMEDLKVERNEEKDVAFVVFSIQRRDTLLNRLPPPPEDQEYESAFAVELLPPVGPGKVVRMRGGKRERAKVHLVIPFRQAEEISVAVKLGSEHIRNSPFHIDLKLDYTDRQDEESLLARFGTIPKPIEGSPWTANLAAEAANSSPFLFNDIVQRTSANPRVESISDMFREYALLDADLQPLAQVAEIELRNGAPTSQWKRLLSQHECLPSLERTPLPSVIAYLRSLSIAFSQSLLPNRSGLTERIDKLIQSLSMVQQHQLSY